MAIIRTRQTQNFIALLGCLFLTSCASFRQPIEKVTAFDELPTVPGQPIYCLALSGGGIRSGAVSLGVLQRLQELGLLDDFTYVASVSGGGYPIYGILARMAAAKINLEELFKNDAYIRKVETQSSFIPNYDYYWKIGESALRAPLHLALRGIRSPDVITNSAGATGYQVDIHHTFSGGRRGMNKSLAFFDNEELKEFPYPIFIGSANTGVRPPINSHNYRIRDLFELSPSWIGSDRTGYFRKLPQQLMLSDAISMSAAAIDAPQLTYDLSDEYLELKKEPVSNPTLPEIAKSLSFGLGGSMILPSGEEVYIADGGFIENQAIVPLVRRGCRHVIALDATADVGAEFLSVKRARAYLIEHYGFDIDELQPTGLGNDFQAKSGWALSTHTWRMIAINSVTKNKTTIDVLKLGLVSGRDYPDPIARYLEEEADTDIFASSRCIGDSLKERCAFPLEQTVRQSYSKSEFSAYRNLGRYLVDEWQKSSPK